MSASSRTDSSHLGSLLRAVRFRQLADQLRHRLVFIPGLSVIGAVVVVQALLLVDSQLTTNSLPAVLSTTVDSARSVFSTIAGGLIASITLLLSIMLVAVQLASSQFSPRTMRDWLETWTLQGTIGLALGTTVLLAGAAVDLHLRRRRRFVPHVTVLVAVVLALVSLVAVVRSVDHVTNNLRVGSIAKRIAQETIEVISANDRLRSGDRPNVAPAVAPLAAERRSLDVPDSAAPVEAERSGWVQQVDDDAILAALPEGTTAYVVAVLGGFAMERTPLIWLDPAPPSDDPCHAQLRAAFAVGDARTMQQDIGFGLVQLTDIAVRALSPGVNDPSTAKDVVVHLGDIMRALWEQDGPETVRGDEDRVVIRNEPRHADHLRAAFDPIRRYGRDAPDVLIALARTLRTIEHEVRRRSLPGPIEPLREMLRDVRHAPTDGWSPHERMMPLDVTRLDDPRRRGDDRRSRLSPSDHRN
ncbi:MAG: DUF2254 domain-containing protein [Ilumatobacteraceae bacterium]